MKQLLPIFIPLLVTLSVNGEPNCTTPNITNQKPPLTLDVYCDTKGPKSFEASNSTHWDDWFFYFENLTAIGINASDNAKSFFNNPNITNFNIKDFETETGVWIAYDYRGKHPEFGKPHPTIQTPGSTSLKTSFQIFYYLHNNASILINNDIHLLNKGQNSGWMNHSIFNISDYQVKVELIVNQPWDFILLDKIILQIGISTSTTTLDPTASTTTTTQKSNTEEIEGDDGRSTKIPSTTLPPTPSPSSEDWDNSSGCGHSRVPLQAFMNFIIIIITKIISCKSC